MATTVTEPIPADVLEDIKDLVVQADRRTNEAIQFRGRAAHLDGEAAGIRLVVDRLVERKLRAGVKDEINLDAGTITRVVEIADPAPAPEPPPRGWFAMPGEAPGQAAEE